MKKFKTITIIILSVACFLMAGYIHYMLPSGEEVVETESFEFDGQAEGENIVIQDKADPIIKDSDVEIVKEFDFESDTHPEVHYDGSWAYTILPEIIDNMPEIMLPDCNDECFKIPFELNGKPVYESYKKKPQTKKQGDATVTVTGTFDIYGNYKDNISVDVIKRESEKPFWIRPSIGGGGFVSSIKPNDGTELDSTIFLGMAGVLLFNSFDLNFGYLSTGHKGIFFKYIF